MTKAQELLEAIKEVSSHTTPGAYSVEMEFSADLSKAVNDQKHSEDDDFAPDVFDDIVGDYKHSYLKNVLDKAIWAELKHIPGLAGANIELNYIGKIRSSNVKTIEDVKSALKDAKFRITVNAVTELDTQNKVAADNAIMKAIENSI